MGSPPLGSRICQTHSLQGTRVKSGRLQTLHMDGKIFQSEHTRSVSNSLCQDPTETIAIRYPLEYFLSTFRVAERKVEIQSSVL